MTDPTPPAGARGPRRPARRNLIGPFSARQVLLALGSVVVAAVIIVVATRPLADTGAGALPDPRATAFLIGSPTSGLRPGASAPELAAVRADGTSFQLLDLDGKAIRLADLRGKAVWLNFWASWCPPCQSETPVLRDVATTYRDRGLVVIGIEVQETVDDGHRYAQRYGLSYTIGADVSGDIFHLYKVFALPTQYLIDSDGVIRQVVNGPVTQGAADALVAQVLPGGLGTLPPPSASPSAAGARPS